MTRTVGSDHRWLAAGLLVSLACAPEVDEPAPTVRSGDEDVAAQTRAPQPAASPEREADAPAPVSTAPAPPSDPEAEPPAAAFSCPRADGCAFTVDVEIRDGPELAVGARVTIGLASAVIPPEGRLSLDIPAASGARDALGVVVQYDGNSVHSEIHSREQLRDEGLKLELSSTPRCRVRFVDAEGQRVRAPESFVTFVVEHVGHTTRLHGNKWRFELFECPDPGQQLVLRTTSKYRHVEARAWVFTAPEPTPPATVWVVELPREADHALVEFVDAGGAEITNIDALTVIAGAATTQAMTPQAAVPRTVAAIRLADGPWVVERALLEHGGSFVIERAGERVVRPAPYSSPGLLRAAVEDAAACGTDIVTKLPLSKLDCEGSYVIQIRDGEPLDPRLDTELFDETLDCTEEVQCP